MGKRAAIKMDGALPAFEHTDVDFVVQELRRHKKPVTVAQFMKRIGIDPRPSKEPGREYRRMCVAFRLAESAGRIEKYMGGHKWCVAGFMNETRAS